MREYRIEKMNDARTPRIEFAGAQGIHGAIPQSHVRSLAEQCGERRDVADVRCVRVNARLEADVHLATVVKVDQKREPITGLIV
jgi:hypothetical protein